MNVRELIASLQEVENKDLPVMFNDSETGTWDVDGIRRVSKGLLYDLDCIIIE